MYQNMHRNKKGRKGKRFLETQKIKLVVCDIDDTLVHKELNMPGNILTVIKELREHGVYFTLATGRMPYRALVFATEAQLDIPFIANNGSILYDRGKIVYAKMLHAGIFKELVRKYRQKDLELTAIFSYIDRERPVVETEWIKARIHKYKGYDETLGDTDEVWNQAVHKVYLVDDSRAGIINEIADELAQMNGDFSYFKYGAYSIEIVAKDCSKATGLEHLLEYLNLHSEEVLAIGDHVNDIEVISMAGCGVAVANADPKLKAVANYVSERERADGVEEAIRKYVLLEEKE